MRGRLGKLARGPSQVSVANVLVEFKKSVQVNIAFQRRLDFLDVNAARRCVIDHGRSQTRCQGVEQMFDGAGSGILAEQSRRLIGLQHKRLRSRLLLAGTVIPESRRRLARFR